MISKQRWSMSLLSAAGKIRVDLGVPFAMDLIVRSEAEVQRRIAGGDGFTREVLKRESHFMLPMTREWVPKAESDYDGPCEALRSHKKSGG